MTVGYAQSQVAKMRLGGLRGAATIKAWMPKGGTPTNFIAYLGQNGEPEYFAYADFSVDPRQPSRTTVDHNGEGSLLSLGREAVLHIGRIDELTSVRANPPFLRHFADEEEALPA